MTSKLKCPVCQQDLGIILCDLDDFFCPGCRMWGSEKLWQALIQAKQDLDFFKEEQDRSATALIERTKELDKCQKYLEIARKTLEEIVSDYEVDASNGWLAANAKQALEQIEHKE